MKRVKIIKDTVSHRIPIGTIVKIKNEGDIRKGKKTYNILDYNCYVTQDDVQFLTESDVEKERPLLVNEEPIKKINETPKPDDWFNSYSNEILKDESKPKQIKRGDRVYAKNVTALLPNGTQTKAKDGVFFVYEISNGRYWLRREDKSDVNEYFCLDNKNISAPLKAEEIKVRGYK